MKLLLVASWAITAVIGAIDPFYGTVVVAIGSTVVALIYVMVKPKGVTELEKRAHDCEERYDMLRRLYRAEGGVS